MSVKRALFPLVLILAAPPVLLYTLWQNPLSAGEDDVGYYYPLRQMVGQSLREGHWPIENPFEATGVPLMADPQSAVLFPATWLFAVLDGRTAYALSIFIAFWIAGGGAYLYLRRIGLMRPAALFGCLAFMFCGFMVGHRVHLSLIHSAAFLPWGLWCLEGLRRSGAAAAVGALPARAGQRSFLHALALVPVVFGTLAAGHWPTFIHVCLIWFVYFCLRVRPLVRGLLLAAPAVMLAMALAGPQILASVELLQQATRQRIGYAMAGENSFFPASGLLAFFPLLMGSRTPGFFPQPWWGCWHLCETLGYVGLATLALAAAGIWKLYRRPTIRHPWPGMEDTAALNGLVRAWTWILLGGGVWMLGYYLPTYKLVHMIPVLGVIRCPARMLLAADMALATLAAVTIHVVASQSPSPARSAGGLGAGEGTSAPISACVRKMATFALPGAMIAAVALLAGGALVLGPLGWWGKGNPFFVGAAQDALAALRPANPALWVPLVVLLATVLAIRRFVVQRRVPLLILLLLADLFVLTRFVDVPPDYAVSGPATLSPAAQWMAGRRMAEDLARSQPWRVYGLSKDYSHRALELLLPKVCCAMGVVSIANYGPFQSPAHAQLLGFNICGYNRDWADLLRRNYLLSLYNVRYLVCEANSEFQDVLDSVKVAPPERIVGGNLLGEGWNLQRAASEGGVLRLSTPYMWAWSVAQQGVQLEPNAIYEISLDARGPEGGGANFLRADLLVTHPDGNWSQTDEMGLSVPAEQIGDATWRHFRWQFRSPALRGGEWTFRVFTMSERTIEVRDVQLCRQSGWAAPVCPGTLEKGQSVYRQVSRLDAQERGQTPVLIYENRLACSPGISSDRPSSQEIERWKLRPPAGTDLKSAVAPRLSISASADPSRHLMLTTVPAGGLYLVAAGVWLWRRRKT